MIQETKSATKPDPIVTDRCEVWVRRNIRETEDGWVADEAHLLLPGPVSIEEATHHADEYWGQAENPAIPPPPLEEQIAALYEAVGELGVLLTEGAL